jgi:uncharacterized protein YegL
MSTQTHISTERSSPPLHSFRLILDGRALSDEVVEALVVAGCADASFGVENGTQVADFDREAPSFEDAVTSAIADIERAVDGLFVSRVEPDGLVTTAGIAERTGRTRQNIAQLISGDRGPGGFPSPVSMAEGRVRIWQWSDVAHWLSSLSNNGEALFDHKHDHFIAALNGTLSARRHLARYADHAGRTSWIETAKRLLDPPRCTSPARTCVERARRNVQSSVVPRLSLIVIVDASQSMTTTIPHVSEALASLQRSIAADEIARHVELTVIEAGASARIVAGPVSGQDFRVPRLQTSPGSSLGEGLGLAIDVATSTQQSAGLVVMLTDGFATDDWRPAAWRLREAVAAHPIRFIGIGTTEDGAAGLKAICPPNMPPYALQRGGIRGLAEWLRVAAVGMSHGLEDGCVRHLPPTLSWEVVRGRGVRD